MLIALLIALAPLQDPVEDVDALRRRLHELEKKHGELEAKIQEALDRGDGGAAVKAREEQKALDPELAEARGTLDGLRKRRGLALEIEAVLSHWDNDLELEDGAAWRAQLHLIPAFGFSYTRWETEDELGDDDARVQAYQLSVGASGNLLDRVTGGIAVAAGLVHFSSEAPGADGDTGPIGSLRPWAVWKLGPHLSFSLGASIDILRTDFNQAETHTTQAYSATAGLALRW